MDEEGTMTLFEAVCDPLTLQQAWLKVKEGKTLAERQKGAGGDGVTVAMWEEGWPERIQALHEALWRGVYRPMPLLWFDVPRREPGQSRRLGIPTVTDRVAQRAAQEVLEPLFEQVFLPCSHGYRPQRSVYTAVAQVLWHQAQGLAWVVDADIADYFNTIPHAGLLRQLTVLEDARLVELVAAWLAVGATRPGLGVAQGAVISPLLANMYLHPFDVTLVEAGLALVRYADDFVILCEDERAARYALVEAADALAALDLALNAEKTTIVRFGPEFEFLGARFCE